MRLWKELRLIWFLMIMDDAFFSSLIPILIYDTLVEDTMMDTRRVYYLYLSIADNQFLFTPFYILRYT